MNQNTLSKIFGVGAACALVFGTALAQETTTTTTTTAGGPATTSVSTMDGAGTITAYTPSSEYITFRTQTNAEPVRYYFTKETTVVDPEGQAVELALLRPDMPVRYTYIRQGDRMLVTKVTLEKPISYYKKETTTTTTTNP